jgi:hypothetical protein
MRTPARHTGATACLAALVLVVVGCSPSLSPRPSTASTAPATPSPTVGPSTTPSPTTATAPTSSSPGAVASGSVDAIYRAIEADVVSIRGLTPKREVQPKTLTEPQLRERIERTFSEDNPDEIIHAREILYAGLGMLERGASLKDLNIELLTSQVAGFYDPDTEELYVIERSGGLGVAERVTFAHEFTHALQDQHFDLNAFALDQIGQGDRNLGGLSLIEGDATSVMSAWAQAHFTPAEALELLRKSLDPVQAAVLARMPPILREPLTFPYESGLRFVLGLQARGGWPAVDDAFARPPTTTEQVLHPEKYAAREAAVALDLTDDLATRMGTGWAVPYEDTLGEFEIQVWLRNALRRVQPANQAAAGWGGDRFAVLEGPAGSWAIVMQTAWETTGDATEFESAATEALAAAGARSARVLPGEGGTNRWVLVASDDATLGKLAGGLGLAG